MTTHNPKTAVTLPEPRRTFNSMLVCLALALIVIAIYYPVAQFGFTNLDDDLYVQNNPHVLSGLNWSNIRWAFGTFHENNWFPLTWISFMVDTQIAGWAQLAGSSQVQVWCWENNFTLFERAIKVTSNNANAHYNLAIALVDHGNYPEALKHLETALRIDSRDTRVLNRLGVALCVLGRHKEAIVHFKKALAISPKSEGTASNLGAALMGAGRTDEAIRIFTDILQRNPESEFARQNLTTARQRRANPD